MELGLTGTTLGTHPPCSGAGPGQAGDATPKIPLPAGGLGTGLSSQLETPGISRAVAFLAGPTRSHPPSASVSPPTADLRRLPGGFSGEGGAGGAAVPARLPQKVSGAGRAGRERGIPGGNRHSRLPARRCLVKWLEVRCVCPMCNKPMAGPGQPRAGIGTLLDELV